MLEKNMKFRFYMPKRAAEAYDESITECREAGERIDAVNPDQPKDEKIGDGMSLRHAISIHVMTRANRNSVGRPSCG